MKSSGPKSDAEATTSAQSDVRNGYRPANTTNWNDQARQTYTNTYEHEQKEAAKRRTGG